MSIEKIYFFLKKKKEKIYFCNGPNLLIKQGHHLNTIHDVSINY